jgi:hypothetical protein
MIFDLSNKDISSIKNVFKSSNLQLIAGHIYSENEFLKYIAFAVSLT